MVCLLSNLLGQVTLTRELASIRRKLTKVADVQKNGKSGKARGVEEGKINQNLIRLLFNLHSNALSNVPLLDAVVTYGRPKRRPSNMR